MENDAEHAELIIKSEDDTEIINPLEFQNRSAVHGCIEVKVHCENTCDLEDNYFFDETHDNEKEKSPERAVDPAYDMNGKSLLYKKFKKSLEPISEDAENEVQEGEMEGIKSFHSFYKNNLEPILEDEKGEETKAQDDEIEIIEPFHPFHSAKPLTDTLKKVRPDPWPPPDSLSNAGETNDNMNSRDLTMREVDQIKLISKNSRFKELVDIFLKSNKKTMYGNKIELKS